MSDFEIISRSEWGARYANGFGYRPVGNLIKRLHHSVTLAPDLVPPFTDDYAAIRALEAIGQSRFGKGMSYNTAFTPAGLIFEGLGIDRVGAHTAGANTPTAGLVLVGNYEKDKPPRRMLEAVSWYLQHGVDKGWWQDAKLNGGHRDVAQTACPGKYAYEQIPAINRGDYREVITLPAKKETFLMALTDDQQKLMLKNTGETATRTSQLITKVDRLEADEKARRAASLKHDRASAARETLLVETMKTMAQSLNLDPERIYELLDKNLQKATADLKITFSAEAEAEEDEEEKA